MGKVSLDPYLFFDGQAKEAMEYYKSIFGGELTIQMNAEVPKEVMEQAPEGERDPNRVMHAKLEGYVVLMASDSSKASPEAKKIELSLSGDDEAKLKGWFDKLSDGGKVTMPLQKQFWGDTFGMVTDKYGVAWMVNISAGEQ